ncbi:hypothetical protein U6G28_09815 [Actinomycetaceae bacterium MB13-C1-2]|nr:hypothetical protein U6G28_09815 [Actinomycetaceae bacterium MB13-C1-2]
MEHWSDFAALMGATFGVLIGLLFVGLSLHADRLSAAPALRSRIAQVLVIFIGLLVAMAIPLVPAPIQVTGALVLLDAVSLITPLMILNSHAKRGRRPARLEVLLDRINPNILSISLLTTTGCYWFWDLIGACTFFLPRPLSGWLEDCWRPGLCSCAPQRTWKRQRSESASTFVVFELEPS